MDHLENFFNRQSDVFWRWRVVRRRRPRPDQEIAGETFPPLLPLVFVIALGMVSFVFVLGAAADGAASGTLLTRAGALAFLTNVRSVFAIIGVRIVFLALFVSYGLTLLSLPYLFFWNRRARRRTSEPARADPPAGVWPPPPTILR